MYEVEMHWNKILQFNGFAPTLRMRCNGENTEIHVSELQTFKIRT